MHRDETNLNSGGGGHVVVAVHEDFRLNDGHEPGLLHGTRVTCESPRVLLGRMEQRRAKRTRRRVGSGVGREGRGEERRMRV